MCCAARTSRHTTELPGSSASDMGRADRSAMPPASVRLEAGRKVLRVGGVIQSVGVDAAHIPDVWDAMITAARPANALILGLGGGTIATLLTQRWGPLPIVGVERDRGWQAAGTAAFDRHFDTARHIGG